MCIRVPSNINADAGAKSSEYSRLHLAHVPASSSWTLHGTGSALTAEWPLSQKEALAAGSGSSDSLGGSPQAWQKVTTRVLLPEQADFAVVHLVAHQPQTPAGTEAAFGEQFADDVRLTLKTQPTLPVRLAQR